MYNTEVANWWRFGHDMVDETLNFDITAMSTFTRNACNQLYVLRSAVWCQYYIIIMCFVVYGASFSYRFNAAVTVMNHAWPGEVHLQDMCP